LHACLRMTLFILIKRPAILAKIEKSIQEADLEYEFLLGKVGIGIRFTIRFVAAAQQYLARVHVKHE
jgi:hypothetical protein